MSPRGQSHRRGRGAAGGLSRIGTINRHKRFQARQAGNRKAVPGLKTLPREAAPGFLPEVANRSSESAGQGVTADPADRPRTALFRRVVQPIGRAGRLPSSRLGFRRPLPKVLRRFSALLLPIPLSGQIPSVSRPRRGGRPGINCGLKWSF